LGLSKIAKQHSTIMSPFNSPKPEPKLVEIPVIGDWKVTYHRLHNIGPEEFIEDNSDEDEWGYFDEDLLQIENRAQRVLIDLGFYPSGQLQKGSFCICVVKGTGTGDHEFCTPEDWNSPAATFRSRSQQEILAKIQEFMCKSW
jgi:hypothetical protein